MAALETEVSSPLGPILRLNGRVPREEAIRTAAGHLREQIHQAQTHLAELENWTTSASRGSVKALTFEEYQEQEAQRRATANA